MMKSRSLFFLLIFSCFSAFSQMEKHARWKYTVSKKEVKAGESIDIVIEAEIDPGWYLYSSDHDPNLDAPYAEFTFSGSGFRQTGKIKAIGAKEKYDDIWEGNIKYFTGKADFRQKITLTEENPVIEISITGQVCSNESGLCVRVMEKFTINDIKVIGRLSINTPEKKDSTSKNPKSTKTPGSYSNGKLKELEKEKQKLIRKDDKGRDITREYLKEYVKKNGGGK